MKKLDRKEKKNREKVDFLLNKERTPLVINITGKTVKVKVDYIKSLLDYDVSASLPEMSNVDVMKMVNFFIHNDIVKANRPSHFNIESMSSAKIAGVDIVFEMELKEQLVSTKDTSEFFVEFTDYFDSWMRKFVILFGKYVTVSNAGKLDELLKKDSLF